MLHSPAGRERVVSRVTYCVRFARAGGKKGRTFFVRAIVAKVVHPLCLRFANAAQLDGDGFRLELADESLVRLHHAFARARAARAAGAVLPFVAGKGGGR